VVGCGSVRDASGGLLPSCRGASQVSSVSQLVSHQRCWTALSIQPSLSASLLASGGLLPSCRGASQVSSVSQLVSHQRCWTALSIQPTLSASLLLWGKTTPVSAGASDYRIRDYANCGPSVTWPACCRSFVLVIWNEPAAFRPEQRACGYRI